MLDGWGCHSERMKLDGKGELGENFNFRFPFSTSASHSRDIEPCHYVISRTPHTHNHSVAFSKAMAVVATNSSTFPLFSRLPPELRNQIWCNAVPDKIGPALYFYREGCWCPRLLSKSDKEYGPEYDENILIFEFCYDLLDDAQFEVPLAFVNREARGIALAWVRKQGIELRSYENRHYPIFVRPFDPMRDALYVVLDKWFDFLCEPDNWRFQPDLFEQLVDLKSDLTRIAVPESLLRSNVHLSIRDVSVFFQSKIVIHCCRRAAGSTARGYRREGAAPVGVWEHTGRGVLLELRPW